ncbi:CAP domain-containing protein [Pseudogracilibacillus sp. SE30717A]|uniref:CAP domain-containing protein n=1 Tax=Pseudogracilibacillus sp. SE30717A TaxID=3098293 RepID=UPI00300DFD8F
MRKLISILIIIGCIVAGAYIVLDKDLLTKEITLYDSDEELPKLKSNQTSKEMKILLKGDIFDQMDQSSDELIKKFGEPVRKDLTPYGYTWWIYTDEQTNVVQFGIENDRVQTIFATGEGIESDPFTLGMNYDEIEKKFPFKNKVTYQTGLSFYSFLLNETDLKMNPLIKLSEEMFAQLYFDTFTNELSSIRILTGDTLLKQRFYEMEYRGSLPEDQNLSDKDWKKIEEGMEKQIFELTNIYRHRHDISPLIKDDQVSEVAFLHSKDMYEHNYFSHYGQDGSGLKERLEKKEVYYLSAGENIAAQHTDAPAAMEGWLNSEGHREALLNDSYTHLGVGVHRFYYTQNFLLKP